MRSKLPIILFLVIAAAGCADRPGITTPDAPSLGGGTLGPGGRTPTDSTGVSTAEDGGGTLGPGGRQ